MSSDVTVATYTREEYRQHPVYCCPLHSPNCISTENYVHSYLCMYLSTHLKRNRTKQNQKQQWQWQWQWRGSNHR